MNERSIFMEALEKETLEERSAFLDAACAGDPALRQRVEALLSSHVEAGSFLGMPIPERLLEQESTLGNAQVPDGSAGASGSREMLASLTPSDKPGSLGRLGHYEVLEVVGSGGMGVVLKAFDEKLRRVVAVKMMASELAAIGTARQRFIREARAAAAVCHENIVTIHQVEEDHRPPYLVMQFIDGVSLQHKISEKGALCVKEILRIGLQTASGLAAAHAQGVVHRDIKPANILLENGVERVRITDFGLARVADEAVVTQSGVIAGTPKYMAPEQAEGKTVDHRSDLFSLGSVLYAMCTGRAPFRGSTTVSILKRVCEETPPPIREINRDIPRELIAIIEKLHAKDPAKRFQSAQEVAGLLEQELARLQHPAGSKFDVMSPAAPAARYPLPRWGVVAATFVLLAAALALTEGLGITRLVATLTGNSPSATGATAKVDEGAATDGPAVKAQRPAAPDSPTPFVILSGHKQDERQFATLAEAVQSASDGDTIEIRGNGPFISQPVSLGRKGLTIRAATGFRPVIKGCAGQEEREFSSLLSNQGPLVLEGLELHMTGPGHGITLHAWAPLHVANCRFVLHGIHSIVAAGTPVCTVRNCEFVGESIGVTHVTSHLSNNGKLILENNLFNDPFSFAIGLFWPRPDLHDHAIHLKHNTMVSNISVIQVFDVVPESAEQGAAPDRQPVQMHVSANLFDPIDPSGERNFSTFLLPDCYGEDAKPLSTKDAKVLVPRLIAWHEERNLYRKGMTLMKRMKEMSGPDRKWTGPFLTCQTLDDWQRLWKAESSGSVEGMIRYEGGDVLARITATPDSLTAEDFRLHPESAGYRAGPDGKDLGADVDLVGPGKAYERWKQTPAYQEWLRDTKQSKAKSPEPEPKAFVLIGGKEVPERKFDALAEAVQAAGDGDTIEIRGNGPFVTESIKLRGYALTIRAGVGFRPVLVQHDESNGAQSPMFEADGPLALEGLELQQTRPQKEFDPARPWSWPGNLVLAWKPLYVANCRFLLQGAYGSAILIRGPSCRMQNCDVICSPDANGIFAQFRPDLRLTIDNSCFWVGISPGVAIHYEEEPNQQEPAQSGPAVVQLTRNTFSKGNEAFTFSVLPENSPNVVKQVNLLRVEASHNLFSTDGALIFAQYGPDNKLLSVADAETALRSVVSWQGQQNVHDHVRSFGMIWSPQHGFSDLKEPTTSIATWRAFWGTQEHASIHARVHYSGGDIRDKGQASPAELSPEDFRLRADSAGYRAGPDGKDLGADVDLVGPGEAYARWKQTPEYQQWLKDTGHLRAEAPRAESDAFVLLTSGKERKFDTLAEAVQAASHGDTIEIRGNGPFVSDGVSITNPLVIRASEGYTPSITLSQAAADKNIPLLTTSSTLVLEGLELRRIGGAAGLVENRWRVLINALDGKELHVANCRLIFSEGAPVLSHSVFIPAKAAALTVRNCQLSGNIGSACDWSYSSGGRCNIENCVSAFAGLGFHHYEPDLLDVSLHVRGNTFVGDCMCLHLWTKPTLLTTPPIKLEFSRNVAIYNRPDRNWGVLSLQQYQLKPPYSAAEAESLLPQLVGLVEKQNVYHKGPHLLRLGVDWGLLNGTRGEDLADWNQFWGLKDTGSVMGTVRFQGGDLLVRALTAPEKLTADDFRLRPDSAGYRAGPNGKDLGANVDLVGPGAAYERWKKTPEYQQWLRETGQRK